MAASLVLPRLDLYTAPGRSPRVLRYEHSTESVNDVPGAPTDEHPGPHEQHHIDGNPTNNRPDNLIMLRRDCHRRVGRDPSI